MTSSQDQRGFQTTEFDLYFERFEIPGGILENSVQGIVQDSLGYMWFASQGGLHRYDGKNFVTYNSDPINQNTLNSDYIENIYLDSRGIIWLTHWSGGGLTSYNRDSAKFTRYVHNPNDPESIMFGETAPVIEDSNGDIWVGGRRGLSRLDRESGKFRHYSHDPDDPHSLSDNEVRELYVDTDGTLWVATGMPWTDDGRGGLNRYDAESDSFERFLHDPEDPTSITNNKVKAMFEDSSGNFWVGTAGDGLHLFDKTNKTFTHFPYDPDNPNKLSMPFLEGNDLSTSNPASHITSIFEDRNNRLWITAVYSGLNVYDPELGMTGHFEAGEEEKELGSNFVWQTFQSDDGTIWVTTAGEGNAVYKVREYEFRIPFRRFDELRDPTKVMRGIIEEPNGTIWIAQSPPSPFESVLESKLWRLDKGASRPILVNLGESSPAINSFMGSISLDSAGNIWAGTWDGYLVGNTRGNNFEAFRLDIDDPEVPWVAPIFQSSPGDIWIPYWGHGVIRYDPENQSYEVFEHNPADEKSISGIQVWAIYEDKSGNIWFGGGSPGAGSDTPPFLDRFNAQTETFERFITGPIPYGMVSSIAEDTQGNLWFLDWNFSLYKLNPGTRELNRYTSGNSLLPASRLQSILRYPDGNLWIATERELIELDPVNETFSIYNDHHGIVQSSGSSGGAALSSDGELLFPRWEGYHAFNPKELFSKVRSDLPDIRITGFSLLDDNISSGITTLSDGVLEEPIWRTEEINLESNENTFAFSIACFDFYDPELNTLQFKLEGYDRGWRSDVQDGETPYYINVPPGTYTFRLRGANGLGVWNTEGIRLGLIINPPWWKTWWAYSLYGSFFILGIIGTHKIQKRRLINRERERSRDKELAQAREIEKAYKQLKTTQEQLILSEKMASLGELTAGIAHEIQNPLNFVNNFAEVSTELVDEMNEELDKGDIPEAKAIAGDLKQNLEKINHHGNRADSIVKGMLQHSRGSEGKKEPTEINQLADEYLRLAYHGLRARDKSFNASMETDLDPNAGTLNIVPQDIGRVILNLVTNAFHAVSEKSRLNNEGYEPLVTLQTRKTNKGTVIRVTDNGPGIPEKLQSKIFQPFFTTKPSGKGTGLGLSMSYEIVTKEHGGEMKVDSKEGEGTEFIVFLPDTEAK